MSTPRKLVSLAQSALSRIDACKNGDGKARRSEHWTRSREPTLLVRAKKELIRHRERKLVDPFNARSSVCSVCFCFPELRVPLDRSLASS